LIVRHETASDREAVFRVVAAAFEGEDVPGLVDALRDSGKVLLSLVAEEDGEVVGHIMFSPMTIDSDQSSFPCVCLSPLAVSPPRQRRGVGSRLVEAGLDELHRAGHGAVFVQGHPAYYPRFGFRPAREFDVHHGEDRDAFMIIELYPGALDGVNGWVKYAKAFDRFV
jgi:putative acetyltransferase